MNPLDLRAVKDACEKATPGPWSVDDDGTISGPELAYSNPELAGLHEEIPGSEDDQDFIAGARTWVPALVARVEALEGAMREIAAHGESGQPETVLPNYDRQDPWWRGYRAGTWECGNVARRALSGEGEGG